MDFRELINKIDSINSEAKKEPERLAFADAINHVEDIVFTPPTASGIKQSSANNRDFKGQDINDPKVKLALFQAELKTSPARLLGEIASRIKPSSDAQMDLSGHVGAMSDKIAGGTGMLSALNNEEKELAIAVIKKALKGMTLERDPDQSEYKDDEDDSMESSLPWKKFETPVKEAGEADKESAIHAWANKYEKYIGVNGDTLPEGWLEYQLDTGIPSDSIETGEYDNYVKKHGEQAGYDLGMDVVRDNPDEFPITNAFMDDLFDIMGGLGEEEAEEVNKVLGHFGEGTVKSVDEGDNIYHSCVKSFKHEKFGEGEVLHGEHTLSESGEVSHYDAKFVREDGSQFIVRNIPVANMKECVVVEHGHPKKKKKVKEEETVEDDSGKDRDSVKPEMVKGVAEKIKAEYVDELRTYMDRKKDVVQQLKSSGITDPKEIEQEIDDMDDDILSYYYPGDIKGKIELMNDVLNLGPDADGHDIVDMVHNGSGLDTSPAEEIADQFQNELKKADPETFKKLYGNTQTISDVEQEDWFQGQHDVTLNGDEFYESFGWIGENDENIEEAEYQGRTVKLNKPMRGDVKKFKVYVKNPKGNVVKVNFGDPDMKIKAYDPKRRKSFRARHNCDNPGPRHKARYWSCRKW